MSSLLTVSARVRTGIPICFSDLGEHFTLLSFVFSREYQFRLICTFEIVLSNFDFFCSNLFFHLIDRVLGFFFSYDFFVEGVEEDFEDDALTLQKSIGSILASLACLEGDQSTVETTALLFFLLTFAFSLSAKFVESSSPWYMYRCVLLVTSPR